MFTGLVQATGKVMAVIPGESSAQITIAAPSIAEQISRGDSVSVNGTCLTVTDFDKSEFKLDVMTQTLNLTAIGLLTSGDSVNLELATRTSDRLGGHIVQGHVDGVATVVAITPGDQWNRLDVEIPAHLLNYVVAQGSICLDGVSLTVGEIADPKNQVTVWLIPETLDKTNLSQKSVGDKINIEVDVLAKYVERLLEKKGENS
jgi:riboflavin synthase